MSGTTSRYLNNRAENSHRPTRRRERQMQRFKSSTQAQRFLSAHGMIYGHFRPRRHLMPADAHRRARARAFQGSWPELVWGLPCQAFFDPPTLALWALVETTRGEPASVRDLAPQPCIRLDLPEVRTMKQPCASVASSEAAGPF